MRREVRKTAVWQYYNCIVLQEAPDLYPCMQHLGSLKLPEECVGDFSAGLSAVLSWNITSPSLKCRLCPLLA